MKLLYLSYTGLAEPLGVSQVLGYLTRLAKTHQITLVTVEKPADLADRALIAERRQVCDAAGIRWIPLRYHHRPRLLATAWDLLVLTGTALREAVSGKADIIHARAYIPCFVAVLIGALTRTPFIFDTRAFWPEELISAGRLKRGSLLHQAIVGMERLCMRRAAGIVLLTRAAADHLRARDPGLTAGKDIVSIPTCADLARFHPSAAARSTGPLRIGSVGTVLSGWFRVDLLFACFREIRRIAPDTVFSILSRDDPDRIRALATEHGFDAADMEITALAPAAVAPRVRTFDALAMFFRSDASKLASCPTRMAEALGSGVPVICNGGIGDVRAIVSDHRVGMLVDAEEHMAAAVAGLDRVLADPNLPDRCRRTAEDLFSTDAGARDYDALYARIIAHRSGGAPQAELQLQ
jgi:glycosyltransferase involved in cell wall biosynthesis